MNNIFTLICLFLIACQQASADSIAFRIPAKATSVQMRLNFNTNNVVKVQVRNAAQNSLTEYLSSDQTTPVALPSPKEEDDVYILTGWYKNNTKDSTNTFEPWRPAPIKSWSDSVPITIGVDDTANGTVSDGHYIYQSALISVSYVGGQKDSNTKTGKEQSK